MTIEPWGPDDWMKWGFAALGIFFLLRALGMKKTSYAVALSAVLTVLANVVLL